MPKLNLLRSLKELALINNVVSSLNCFAVFIVIIRHIQFGNGLIESDNEVFFLTFTTMKFWGL